MATMAAILEIGVRADTTRASSQLTRLNSSLNRTATQSKTTVRQTDALRNSTRRLGPSLASAAKYAIGLGAAYVGLQAAKEAVTATTDLAKSTLTLKKGFGLTIGTASELGAVLKARGADASSVGMAFNTLSRQVEAAKGGSDTAKKAFDSLGVTMEDLKKSSPDELLFQVSDGMEKLGRGTERTAATSALFGRGWKTIGPVLREGSDSLKEQTRSRLLMRKLRAERPELTIKARQRYRANNPETLRKRGREATYARRAKMPFSQELADLMAELVKQPCVYCGATENITIDHIVPLARDGKHEASNLAPACRPCNSSKSDRLLSEWPGRFLRSALS